MLKINAKKYFIVAAVILLLVFLHYSSLAKPVENLLSKGLSPIFKKFYSLSSVLSQAYRDQTNKQNLADELKQAEIKINQLTVENAKWKFLEEENLALRKQLNFLVETKHRYLLANIVSRDLSAADVKDSQPVVIDKGSLDGLVPGLAVVGSMDYGTSSQGVIIGKVMSVKEHLASIYLITNKNCKLAASILGESKTTGIAHGELGLTVKMEFIPQTQNIKIDDIVATSGLEQNIPRGLVIGRVSQVIKENNEVWQSATIEPLLSLDSLSIVSILLP